MQQRKELALALKLLGYSYRAIGEKLGISGQRAYQIISPPGHVRTQVVQQAAGRCQDCQIHVGSQGHVHHKGSDTTEDFNDVDNLVLLCASCHRRAHGAHLYKDPEIPEPTQKQYMTCYRCNHQWVPMVSQPKKCPNGLCQQYFTWSKDGQHPA